MKAWRALREQLDAWRRVWQWRRSAGGRGEQVAREYLRRQGYQVLARNLRCRLGEVDLLMQDPDGRTIVVVEVKASEGHDDPLPPEIHVNRAKQRRLVTLACHIARRYRLTDRPIRFDVVGVDLLPGEPARVRHHAGAFESHV